jgi:hypothetical protein
MRNDYIASFHSKIKKRFLIHKADEVFFIL